MWGEGKPARVDIRDVFVKYLKVAHARWQSDDALDVDKVDGFCCTHAETKFQQS